MSATDPVDVFVGLVTHRRSRFDADGTATRQAGALVAAMRSAGLAADLLVSDRDDYDPRAYPLDRRQLLRSATYAAGLEHRWRRYLARAGGRPARPAMLDAVAMAGMSAKRAFAAGQRTAATRLINIDLSHLRCLEAGGQAGAPWILVLEDDARVDDPVAAASMVREAIGAVASTAISFVSLSESIGLTSLGVEGIVGPARVPDGPPWLVRTSTPVTNTVCANLYRAGFAEDLAAGIRRRGLVPVAPIDWRVNEEILTAVATGRLGADSCAWAVPGLFRQASMHAGPESP